MADNARPPFRADHVGSLLRPPEVLRARDEFAAGRLTAEQLKEVEDEAIRENIRMQAEVGLKSATDGELRRESWHMDFIYQLGGIRKVQDDTIKVAFHNKDKDFEWAPPSAHVAARSPCRRRSSPTPSPSSATTSRSARPPSSRSRPRAWCTTAAAAPRSTRRCTPTWSSSGTTSRRRTPRKSASSTASAAATSSWTTPAWRT